MLGLGAGLVSLKRLLRGLLRFVYDPVGRSGWTARDAAGTEVSMSASLRVRFQEVIRESYGSDIDVHAYSPSELLMQLWVEKADTYSLDAFSELVRAQEQMMSEKRKQVSAHTMQDISRAFAILMVHLEHYPRPDSKVIWAHLQWDVACLCEAWNALDSSGV